MPQTVRVGNQTFTFPDGMPPDQMQAEIDKVLTPQAGPQAPQPPMLQRPPASAPPAAGGPEVAQPGFPEAFGRSALQGATMGWGDEGLAGIRSVFNGRPFAQNLEEEKQRLDQISQQFPGTKLAGNIAGALGTAGLAGPMGAPKVGAGMLRQMAQGGAMGAAFGAASGAGENNENRAQGAQSGGLLGGLLSGIAPPLARGGGALAQYVVDRLPQQAGEYLGRLPGLQTGAERAQSMIFRDMRRDNLTPDILQQRAAQMNAMGKPAVLADAGGANMAELGDAAAMLPSNQKTAVLDRMTDRAEGQGARVQADISKAAGRPLDKVAQGGMFSSQMRAATPLYEQAFRNAPPVTDPVILKMLETRPALRQAFSLAKATAANEGRVLPNLFNAKGQLVTKNGVDLEIIDSIKKSLDDIIYNHTWVQGRNAGRTNYVRSVREASAALMDRVDNLVDPRSGQALYGEYKLARDIFAGPAALNNALKEGAEFPRRDVREVRAALQEFSTQGERQAFRDGVVDSIIQSVGRGDDSRDAVKAVFGSPEKRAILAEVIGNPTAVSFLEDAMKAESNMARTQRVVMGNSRTTQRQQKVADMDGLGGVSPGAFTSPLNMGMALAGKGLQWFGDRGRNKAAGDISKLLLTDNAEDAAIALRGYYDAMLKRGRRPSYKPGTLGIVGGLLSQ